MKGCFDQSKITMSLPLDKYKNIYTKKFLFCCALVKLCNDLIEYNESLESEMKYLFDNLNQEIFLEYRLTDEGLTSEINTIKNMLNTTLAELSEEKMNEDIRTNDLGPASLNFWKATKQQFLDEQRKK